MPRHLTTPESISEPEIFCKRRKRPSDEAVETSRRKEVSRKKTKQESSSELDLSAVAPGKKNKASEPSKENVSFDKLSLSDWILTTCKELGMRTATAVQAACIPAILDKKHVIAISETGSGKTAAYALPILETLQEDPYGVFALVLTPTRELAIQIGDQFRALGSGMKMRDLVVIGGEEMTTQAQKLTRRPHVVIATPGRLRDHLASDPSMAAVFAGTKFLVLDEADRLLDGGFASDLELILASLHKKRQTLLFSATYTTNLKAVEELGMGNSVFHFEAGSGVPTIPASLRQEYVFIPANVKEVYLAHIVQSMEDLGLRSAMIFASTCRMCHLLHETLSQLGIQSVELNSLLNQGRRMASLAKFRSGQTSILVATDVASRGLDIPTVDLVVNYDIPRFTRDYVHRVGRTARAGRGGLAISFISQYDVELVHNIEELIGRKLGEHQIEEDAVLKRITKVFKAKRAALMKMSESGFDDLVKARKQAKSRSRIESKQDKEDE